MKSFTRSIETMIIIFFLIPLAGSDCDGESNVGYHSISIPGYEIEDYSQMLNDKNPETRYNAICNLYLLTEENVLNQDTMIGKPEYLRDLNIYEKIYPMMDSNNSWISSAAIRFIGKYKYNEKKFINHILQISDPSLNVQLAVWYNFKLREGDQVADSALLVKKTNYCFDHPSSLIRQCGYDYIDIKTAHQFEEKLKTDYSTVKEEYSKMQIIDVLGMHLCDSSFYFLTKEYTSSKDTNLQKIILSVLPNTLNRQLALNWFSNHPKETERILQSGLKYFNYADTIYYELLKIALNQGWDLTSLKTTNISSDPEKSGEEFPILFAAYFEFKHNYETTDTLNTKQTEVMNLVGKKIASTPPINKLWMEYEKKHIRYLLPKQFIDEQMQITTKYNEALTSLYKRYHTDSSMYDSYLKDLKYLKDDLSKRRVEKIKQQ